MANVEGKRNISPILLGLFEHFETLYGPRIGFFQVRYLPMSLPSFPSLLLYFGATPLAGQIYSASSELHTIGYGPLADSKRTNLMLAANSRRALLG